MIVAEWVVPPVVENVVIEPYAVPGAVAYLHVAASLVATESVVDEVLSGSVPDGAPAERTGAVESPGAAVVVCTVMSADVLLLLDASVDAMRKW